MRILLVTDWPPLEGGTERYVADVQELLQAAGDGVRLLTSSAGSAGQGRAEFIAHGSRTKRGRAITQVANPTAAWVARRAVTSFQPDVAHVNMFLSFLSPVVLDGLRGVPTVVTLHDYRAICPIGWNQLPDGSPCPHEPGAVCRREGCIRRVRRVREAARFALIRRSLSRAARILTISTWMESVLDGVGVRSEHLALPVPPSALVAKQRAPHPLFVYGGRLDPEKGVDLLIRAFAALRRSHPTSELRISGDGADAGRLKRLAGDLGCSVTFIPGMTGPDWWRTMAGAWCAVIPSTWEEPLGLVAIESILRGVPVIAADSGGLSETVSQGSTGLLYPRGDVAALTAQLEAVASRSALRAPLPSHLIQQLAARHDPYKHVARLRQVYAEVAA